MSVFVSWLVIIAAFPVFAKPLENCFGLQALIWFTGKPPLAKSTRAQTYIRYQRAFTKTILKVDDSNTGDPRTASWNAALTFKARILAEPIA
jgi:hypothetical protein